jgi:DNA-binding transcriptional LysR family regulator
METRRLAVLLELSRLGSMREVAEEMGTTTSTVSQQIAALAREAGTALVEPDGRRVRLTPAGRRLAEHAVTILAAVEAARLDLDPGSEPAGTVRVAGFETAVRRTLMPVLDAIARSHPSVRMVIHEHEPAEAFSLLRTDDVDLALTYDYDLAPADFDMTLESTPLWTTRWSLGVPAGETGVGGDARQVFARFADRDWVVNSRNTADADVVRTIASMAGFEPRVSHRVDSLELVQDLIAAGLVVGLLPADQPTRAGVVTLPLDDPQVRLRAYAVVRRGRSAWPPLAMVLARIRATLDE